MTSGGRRRSLRGAGVAHPAFIKERIVMRNRLLAALADPDLPDIMAADRWARTEAGRLIQEQ